MNHMSRTYKTAPANIRAFYSKSSLKEERHEWCENETIDNAWYSRRHRRAIYKTEVIGHKLKKLQFVKMVDENGAFFGAETTDRTYSNPDGVKYDKEEHPGAVFVYNSTYYGGEIWKARIFYDKWVDVPKLRSYLAYWEEEPRRECDIDKPDGLCHYVDYYLGYGHGGGKNIRRIVDEKPRRAYARDVLHQAKEEYNSFGETDIEPEARWDCRIWW